MRAPRVRAYLQPATGDDQTVIVKYADGTELETTVEELNERQGVDARDLQRLRSEDRNR